MSDLPIFTRKADEEITALKQRVAELEAELDVQKRAVEIVHLGIDRVCEALKT